MGKLINTLVLMGGISLLFYFTGLLTDTASSGLLTLLLNPEGMQSSGLVTTIIGITAGVLVVVSTFIARNSNSDTYLMIPLVTAFLSFGWDFLTVYNKVAASSAVGGMIAVLVFAPLLLAYVIGVVEWWRGVET
jgi:hypothetical protein